MEKFVIDSHSHIGKDIFHGESTIEGYIDFAKKSGISAGVLMTVPSPCTELGNPDSRLMYWKYDDNKMRYYGNRNPFMDINYQLSELIQNYSSEELQLLFAPVYHPILDDNQEFIELINKTNPVAIKIHGIGSGIGPKDINKESIEMFKDFQLPLIVHTDCDFGAGSASMQYVRNINRGILWAKFFENNQIKGILNHGATLDKEVFEIVNNSKYLKIALGPDKVACLDNNRLYIDCLKDYRNYLMYLKQHLKTSKIVYDSDYNWNFIKGEDTDYKSVERVIEVFQDEFDIYKILAENLIEFNPKILERIRR